MKYLTHSEADTLRFAGRLAELLRPGDAVLLHGDLGAGKSVFARGVARALGVTGAMPSPTFTLLIPYEGRQKLYHFDLYRLNDPEEFYAAGLDEFIGGDGIAMIEWPEMAEEAMPQSALTVTLTYTEDGLARCAQLTPGGAFDESRIAQILTHMEEDDEHPDD